MFNFGTSDEQVVDLSHTNIETGDGQVLVSKTKLIQTGKNNTNYNKQQNLKKLNLKNPENGGKQKTTVPYKDNLKTSSNKNYDEPL